MNEKEVSVGKKSRHGEDLGTPLILLGKGKKGKETATLGGTWANTPKKESSSKGGGLMPGLQRFKGGQKCAIFETKAL